MCQVNYSHLCVGAKSRQLGEVLDLSDSFICSSCENEMSCSVLASKTVELVPEEGKLTLNVYQETLINARKNDCTPSCHVCQVVGKPYQPVPPPLSVLL